MKIPMLIFVSLLVALTNLKGQWLNFEPSLNYTFAVSQILTYDQENVYALGYKMLTKDNVLGIPNSDSLFLLKSDNGGNTWQSNNIYFGTDAFPTDFSIPAKNIIYIGGITDFSSNSKVIKSTDNGQTWIDVTPPPNLSNNYINILKFYDNDFGIVTGDAYVDEFTIYHTSDGGNSWSKLPADQIPDANLSEFSKAGESIGDYLWFTTNYGRIYKSADRGFHWEVHQSILNNLDDISFSDTLNGIALYGFVTLDFNTSPIIITADGGKTWKTLNITPLGPKTGIFGASYIPNSSYIMLTTAKNSLLTGDFATWISPDRGETWQQISNGEFIYTLNFLDASTGWGGEGQQLAHPTRMFQYTGSPLVGLFSNKALQVDWDIFPNPTADRVQVRVQEDKPSSYLLLVNDLQGKLILRQDWDGTGMLDLDLGACANGLYTLTLASKDGKAVRKLVVAQ